MNNDLTEKLFNFYPTLYKKAENTGSSRFRGVTTTYSARHIQIIADLQYQAKYVEISDRHHICHSSVAL